MTQPDRTPTVQPAAEPTTLYCANHPERETLIRCGRCGKPICLQCRVRHPVGIRCKECAQIRKDPLTSLTPPQYGLAFVSALGASIVGGFIAPYLGLLFAFFIGPLIGGGIAEFVGRVIGYKRGLPLTILVSVCIVLGVIIAQLIAVLASGRLPLAAAFSLNTLATVALSSVLPSIVYIIFAIGGAVARLR